MSGQYQETAIVSDIGIDFWERSSCAGTFMDAVCACSDVPTVRRAMWRCLDVLALDFDELLYLRMLSGALESYLDGRVNYASLGVSMQAVEHGMMGWPEVSRTRSEGRAVGAAVAACCRNLVKCGYAHACVRLCCRALSLKHANSGTRYGDPAGYAGPFLLAVRDVVPNPYRDYDLDGVVALLRRRPEVRRLAVGVQQSGDYGACGVLADALEESGLAPGPVTEHLRLGTGHGKYCWAVRLISGEGLRVNDLVVARPMKGKKTR